MSEWLPKYAPELNDIAHHLAHQTFGGTQTLGRAIHAAVAALNIERTIRLLANPGIPA